MNNQKNIEFIYSYTDSQHAKTTGEIVFANPDNMPLSAIEYQVRSRLIQLEYFYHSDFMVPSLFGEYADLNVNPAWHTFVSIDSTDKEPTDKRTISDFIAGLK
jgi:hypothetical protein